MMTSRYISTETLATVAILTNTPGVFRETQLAHRVLMLNDAQHFMVRCRYRQLHFNASRYRSSLPSGRSDGAHLRLRNGKPYIREQRVNGRKGGYRVDWHESGRLWQLLRYMDGKRFCEYWRWYESGAQYEHCKTVNGKRHGIYSHWYESGQLCARCTYIAGVVTDDVT